MTEFARICALEDIPPGSRLQAEVGDEAVILFNINGTLYCIADLCSHDGEPLEDGDLVDCTIECPRHGALFDIRTGKATRLPATEPIPTYQVKVENNDILVEVPPRW